MPTLYAKNLPREVIEDINRCAAQERPDPMTLAAYVEHIHGFYQTRRGTTAFGPVIDGDGVEEQAAASGRRGDGADMLHAKAALLLSVAAVAEKVRGRTQFAQHVRAVISAQLEQFAPAPPAPKPPRRIPVAVAALPAAATPE